MRRKCVGGDGDSWRTYLRFQGLGSREAKCPYGCCFLMWCVCCACVAPSCVAFGGLLFFSCVLLLVAAVNAGAGFTRILARQARVFELFVWYVYVCVVDCDIFLCWCCLQVNIVYAKCWRAFG